jgi:hypothetical protein
VPPRSEPVEDWLGFVDVRVREAVRSAAQTDDNPDDALRGLYISDEQALALAADPAPSDIGSRLAIAAERLGLDALDAAVLAVCAVPELEPRLGRLYAYLQDDITRRLASPRLAAQLLSGDDVEPRDVLACFGPRSRLSACGALRLLSADASTTLADRPLKLADRLVAFLLGAGGSLAEAGAPAPLRRVQPDPEFAAGREDTVALVAQLLSAGTALPLLACGPDAASVVAAAAGTVAVLLRARDLQVAGALADAVLASALEDGVLCLDGIGELKPEDRGLLLAAIDERPAQTVLLADTRAGAVAVSDCAVLLVDVPLPGVEERRRTWERLTGVQDAGGVAAKFRLSAGQIRAAAEVSRVTARAVGRDVPDAGDLASRRARDAARAGLSLGRPRAARAPARAAALDLGLPATSRPRPL